jgi:membrane protein implicated in regulation of membrane protease activity
VKTGPQTLVGTSGEVRLDGLVFVDGELWRAHSSDGSQLFAGERVEVDALDGLELTVTPLRGSTTTTREPSTSH